MPRCARCSKDVYDAEEVTAAGLKWHQSCFKCKTCARALNSANLRDKDKEIYCEHCYGKQFGAKGYGFGGGGGVGLSSGKFEGAEDLHGSAAIDAEIQRKLNLKYDSGKEGAVRSWLEELLGERFPEKTLQEALKSGARLCKAANKVSPNLIKNVNNSNFAAMQRENISYYIKACNHMAFNKASMFETQDLFEGKNMVLVLENLVELSNRAKKRNLPSIQGEFAAPAAGAADYKDAAPAAAAAPAPAAQAEAAPAPAAAGGGGEGACPDCGAERSGDFCADCGHKFDE